MTDQSDLIPLSLQAYTQLLGDTLRRTPALQMAWVTAELSDVRVSGGHCYMELIEKNEAGQTVAKMRATLWASVYARVRVKFEKATGRSFASGLKLMLCGSATHHNVYGLSFNVIDVDPSYTLGDMERLRREILRKLETEGVIGFNKNLPFPDAPQRIAIISAAGAAGYGDFMNHLSGNPYGFVFYPVLFPAVMQGDRTSESVREALHRIEMTVDLWDCIVIIRGGGATSDLNGFDDYELAKAVATFPVPIIVGIGHERDRTVLDEIAHTRVKTPTAGAAILIDRLQAAFEKASVLTREIASYASLRSEGEKRNLAAIEAMIPSQAGARMAEAKSRLAYLAAKVPVAATALIERSRSRLLTCAQVVAHAAETRILSEQQNLRSTKDSLAKTVAAAIYNASLRLERAEALVKALDPQRTLERGFAVVSSGGKTLKSSENIPDGTDLHIRLADGCLKAVTSRDYNKNAE